MKVNAAAHPTILALALFAGLFGGTWLFSGPDDGIKFDTDYDLAVTYAVSIAACDADLAAPGNLTPGRVFDMADRSLPKPSILVPERDGRGVPLVRHDPGLEPGKLRKVMRSVDGRTVEETYYPAYEYLEWQFNPRRELEIQLPTPVVKPDC